MKDGPEGSAFEYQSAARWSYDLRAQRQNITITAMRSTVGHSDSNRVGIRLSGMSWSANLDPKPIAPPDRRALETLADCRTYMFRLPSGKGVAPVPLRALPLMWQRVERRNGGFA